MIMQIPLLLLIIAAAQARRQREVSPQTLGKWHDLYTWHNPTNWNHHDEKLDYMCEQLVTHHENTPQAGQHVRDVWRCCALGSGESRLGCIAELQATYANFCCNDFLMRRDSPCCAKSGTARMACFHAAPPVAPVCSPPYSFDRHFRAQAKPGAEIDDAVADEIAAGFERTLDSELENVADSSSSASSQQNEDYLSSSKSSSSSSSSSSQEIGSSSEEREESDWLTESGLENAVGSAGLGCIRAMPFPSLRPHVNVNKAQEFRISSQGNGSNCCGPCCKVGAEVGRKLLKPHECPYTQCRRFWARFYHDHRRLIKHPKCCGFAFVACCEKQHHLDAAMMGPIDEAPAALTDDFTVHLEP